MERARARGTRGGGARRLPAAVPCSPRDITTAIIIINGHDESWIEIWQKPILHTRKMEYLQFYFIFSLSRDLRQFTRIFISTLYQNIDLDAWSEISRDKHLYY